MTTSAGVGDIVYSTCFANGYFTAWLFSPSSSITGFGVFGELGADGAGSVVGGPLGESSSMEGVYGFYKSVDDELDQDPGVNHLMLVNEAGW